MPTLTSVEKVVIIKNWTLGIDISHDRSWAKLIYGNGMIGSCCFEFTPTRKSYDNMIDDAFTMVYNRVWGVVCELSNS